MKIRGTCQLVEMEWPEFGLAQPPPAIEEAEYGARMAAARERMAAAGLTHLVVYGDREHFANLAYLTGFDPRFEEALLVIGPAPEPLLIVGNECEGYLPASPLFRSGKLRHELYQPFSLLDQPRGKSRILAEILAGEGITQGTRAGCAGWKYFGAGEEPAAEQAIELPAFIVDNLRQLAGPAAVVNATAIFMDAANGLRASASAAEIAYFEYTNTLAAEGIRRMFMGLHEGMSDHELMSLARLNGLPLGCHPTLATGANWQAGLYSPTGQIIQRGFPLSTNVCYWGSNICRAGWVAEAARDLPEAARDYLEAFAAPYFEAIAAWLRLLTIGRPGHALWELIQQRLPFERFGIFLNPGHLIHLDEWLSSPIYEGSTIPLRSGMVIQVDVIPFSPIYGSTRVEDGVVLADADLRQTLAARYPDAWARIGARRRFMQEQLGLELPAELLPLSNIPGIVAPFLLAPNQVLALR